MTLSLTPGEGLSSKLVVTPSKFTFSKRSSGTLVRVEIIGESEAELLQDRQFTIEHKTISKSYEYHKLSMPVQVYRLGVTFVEIAGAGQDEMLQVGSEESYAALRGARELHCPKFESMTYKVLIDAQADLERQKLGNQSPSKKEFIEIANSKINELAADISSGWLGVSTGLTYSVGVK